MLGAVLGFIELGGIVLAWMVFWSFLVKGFTAQHPDNAAAQGLAAVFHA